VYYEIYLDRPPVNGVPLLHLVTRVVPGAENPMVQFRWDYANDFSVVVQARGDTGIALSAESDLMIAPPEVLRAAPSNYDAYMASQDLAQLTYQDLLPETKVLVQRLTRNAATPYDRIMALQRYLNGADFEYSRVVPPLPSKNAMDAFILQERRGHCQFFASALALMVRSLGMPARVVQGYRGGTWDPSDQSYTVTEDMAHLWTEVYFPTVGWIAFDPSPMDRQDEVTTIGRLSRMYSRYVLRARLFWLRNVVAYNNNERGQALRDFSARIFSYGGDTWDRLQSRDHQISPGGLAGRILAGTAGVAAAVALVWALMGVRVRRRRSSVVLTADQRRAARLYGGMQRRLRKLGVTIEGRTAEEIADEALAIGLRDIAVIPAAVQLYNDARFGRRALSAGEYATWRRRISGLGPGLKAD
jgi:transglutaminase-like putative cysteine protease